MQPVAEKKIIKEIVIEDENFHLSPKHLFKRG